MAAGMSSTTGAVPPFLARLAPWQRELEGNGPAWVRELRRAGRARFDELGLPHPRLEQWRATSVAPLARTELHPGLGPTADLPRELPEEARLALGGPRAVFVDGRYRPELSAPGGRNGLWIGSLAEALLAVPERVRPLLERRDPAADEAFAALNSAFLEDGGVVLIPAEATVAEPIQLLYVSAGSGRPSASSPRTLIHAGRGSRASVVEHYLALADDPYFTNAVTDVVLDDGAGLDHCRVQQEHTEAFHVSATASVQGRDSRYRAVAFDLGGRLVRHDVSAVLDGEGGSCELDGLVLTRGAQHVDNHTILDHARPHCSSRELYKGILDGRSRTVFNGRIVVRQDAQKTDAKQSNPNLLLSEGALAQTRPQLEIYADDVKCTHGATVGRLDEEAIFYLRSRAIARDAARNLLIHAFADEVLARVAVAGLRERLQAAVSRLLGAGA